MNITERDNVEKSMGKSVQLMDADELIRYYKMSMKQRYDLDTPPAGLKEISIMKGHKRHYGTAAGEIIKWVFIKHDGKCAGNRVTLYDFAKGHRWWTDRILFEVQESAKKSEEQEKAKGGFMTLDKLLGKGSSAEA